MPAAILPSVEANGTFEVWSQGVIVKDGFPDKVEAAIWANDAGYIIT